MSQPDLLGRRLLVVTGKGGVGKSTVAAALVWLEDGKGRKVGVPADKVGYVELVVDDGSRKVGFGR